MPKVLVSAAPLQPLVDAILSGMGKTSVLARPGQDAHSMVLSPSQARALVEAEIIILPDRHLSNTTTQLAERATARGVLVIYLTELAEAQPLPYPTQQAWLGEADEDDKGLIDAKALNDPHIWLDPLRMAALVEPLAARIGGEAPNLKALMLANAKQWRLHVENVTHPQLQTMLAKRTPEKKFQSRPYIPFITGHVAYQYFFSRYGIDDPGSITLLPEGAFGARSTHSVLKRADEVSIGCLIAEHPTAMVKRVAKASGARVVTLNPELIPLKGKVSSADWVRDDYDRLMWSVAHTFSTCL